jgi:hypothetical protein
VTAAATAGAAVAPVRRNRTLSNVNVAFRVRPLDTMTKEMFGRAAVAHRGASAARRYRGRWAPRPTVTLASAFVA